MLNKDKKRFMHMALCAMLSFLMWSISRMGAPWLSMWFAFMPGVIVMALHLKRGEIKETAICFTLASTLGLGSVLVVLCTVASLSDDSKYVPLLSAIGAMLLITFLLMYIPYGLFGGWLLNYALDRSTLRKRERAIMLALLAALVLISFKYIAIFYRANDKETMQEKLIGQKTFLQHEFVDGKTPSMIDISKRFSVSGDDIKHAAKGRVVIEESDDGVFVNVSFEDLPGGDRCMFVASVNNMSETRVFVNKREILWDGTNSASEKLKEYCGSDSDKVSISFIIKRQQSFKVKPTESLFKDGR